MSATRFFYSFCLVSFLVTFYLASLSIAWLHLLWLFAPIILLGLFDITQKKHTLLRIYPVIGHIRYLMESIRPEIQQYFVETDTNGRPISREFRSLIYQRAKGVLDTRPFGTLFEVYDDGYEWVNHSIAPKDTHNVNSDVVIGGSECSQPYTASALNISAMSYGSLSKNAILALNKGAKDGNFAHNTGEGGLSPYHLKPGGDLIWQIGTGYFGCRDKDGKFNQLLFQEKAASASVKMIELKLSQGAKPGHGGILPACKLTKEIAEIRHVPMGQDVLSPAGHSAFDSPVGLLEFIQQLRKLSGGKPIGFKLCVGHKREFISICKAMLHTGITPDFITIDGGEGGTGAAPVELTNSVGMPVKDALVFVNNMLIGCGLRDKIKLIASGKSFSAFHLLRLLALGADTVNSARAMMIALGCIQSRSCNTDRCPTGIATQDPTRYKALDVAEKAKRVAKYQNSTIHNLHELLAAMGLTDTNQLQARHINRRVKGTQVATYAELYDCISNEQLLDEATIPADLAFDWAESTADSW
jgi:glutamate synthase domain-containing protein 2